MVSTCRTSALSRHRGRPDRACRGRAGGRHRRRLKSGTQIGWARPLCYRSGIAFPYDYREALKEHWSCRAASALNVRVMENYPAQDAQGSDIPRTSSITCLADLVASAANVAGAKRSSAHSVAGAARSMPTRADEPRWPKDSETRSASPRSAHESITTQIKALPA